MYLVHVFLVYLADSHAVVVRERFVDELLVRYLLVSEQVGDVGHEEFHRERLLDVAVGAGFESLDTRLHSYCRSEEDDRHMAEVGVGLDHVAEFASVHDRHHHVADDKVNLFLFRKFKSICTVCRCEDIVFCRQFLCQISSHFRRVFSDQNAVP